MIYTPSDGTILQDIKLTAIPKFAKFWLFIEEIRVLSKHEYSSDF